MDGNGPSDADEPISTEQRERPARSSLIAALDALGAGVALYDASGRLEHVNAALRAMFPDLAPALVPGMTFQEAGEAAAASGYFPRRIDGRDSLRLDPHKPGYRGEIELTDGRWVLLETKATAEGGHLVSYTDITDYFRRGGAAADHHRRLDLALEASNEGLWDWDLETGTAYYSERWKAMLGYRPEELPDTLDTWRSHVHPADLAGVEADLERAMAGGGAFCAEFRMRHRDGGWRRVLSRATISRAPDGRVSRVVGVQTDISDLRALQDREARTAARLEEAERLAAVGSRERDATGQEHWSPGLRCLLGLEETIPASRETLLSVVHPEDRERAETLLEDGYGTLRIVRPDGTEGHVLASAKRVPAPGDAGDRVIGAWLDITRMRQIEDRAARAEVHMLGAIETVGDGIILLDPEKRIVMLNSQYADDFPGLEAFLVPGAPFTEFLKAMHARGVVLRFDGIPGDEDWLTPRLNDVGSRSRPFEMELAGGRWFLIKETRTADDYILIVRTDITELKRREQALAESRARLRGMFDRSVQFIGLLSPDGTLLEVNNTALAFIGGRREDVIGRPFWDTDWRTHDPNEQDRLKRALDVARRGERARIEVTHRSATGDLHIIDLTVTPVHDDDGTLIMLIPEGRDITAQYHAEEALRRNTRFVQALADTAQTPIYAHDRRGRYLFCNDAFSLAVGRPLGEIIGKSIYHTTLREVGINVQEINRDLLVAGGAVTYEARVALGDGSLRDMIVTKSTYNAPDGTVEGILAVLADITAQKQAERRFADFARSSADWFWEMDRRGRFTYVSDRIGETTGFRAADLVGRHRDDFVDTTWNAEGLKSYRKALEAQRPIRNFVYRTVPVRGQVHYVRVNAVPVYDAEGNFIGFRGTGSEVSAETKAQAALKAAKEQAEIASRTKTEFLAAMSHELRTPLNAIIGFSEIMQMQALGPIGNDTYVDYARDIHKSGAHLLTMVNDVLDASRLETGRLDLHPEPVDLAALAHAAAMLVRRRAEDAEVTLLVDTPEALPPYRADEGRLKKALTGLLDNGIKFTPQGGSVTLRMRRDPDGSLQVLVEDTGIGMSPADANRAVQPFTQLDSRLSRRYEGMGLGLTLARDIVELHGGRLDIQSRAGHGTTIVVRLPAEGFDAAP